MDAIRFYSEHKICPHCGTDLRSLPPEANLLHHAGGSCAIDKRKLDSWDDLLSALKHCREVIEHKGEWWWDLHFEIERIDAALAKAEGKE